MPDPAVRLLISIAPSAQRRLDFVLFDGSRHPWIGGAMIGDLERYLAYFTASARRAVIDASPE